MANQEHITKGMQQTQNAIEFINKSVLKPDVNPMKGTAAPMIDQATGMMVQDLQMFLKGFEQVGLVALARLANNILTYGNYYGPKPTSEGSTGVKPKPEKATTLAADAEQVGTDLMSGLFSMVTEYGKIKAEISSSIHNNHNKKKSSNPKKKKSSNSKASTSHPPANAAAAFLEEPNTAQQSAEKANTQEKNEPFSTQQDEQNILKKSIAPEIFTPAADTKNTSDVVGNTEQATEGKKSDNNDDDEPSNEKTFWFPRKK